MSASGIMLGPSLGAWSGSWWVSMNRAATPMAVAARASGGANSRWPPSCAVAAGLLDRVGDVEHDGVSGPHHDGQGAEIGDEGVVAEAGAALG